MEIKLRRHEHLQHGRIFVDVGTVPGCMDRLDHEVEALTEVGHRILGPDIVGGHAVRTDRRARVDVIGDKLRLAVRHDLLPADQCPRLGEHSRCFPGEREGR
jgi:hypothetical protein